MNEIHLLSQDDESFSLELPLISRTCLLKLLKKTIGSYGF